MFSVRAQFTQVRGAESPGDVRTDIEPVRDVPDRPDAAGQPCKRTAEVLETGFPVVLQRQAAQPAVPNTPVSTRS